jgi:hypothetical protein
VVFGIKVDAAESAQVSMIGAAMPSASSSTMSG